MNTKRTVRIFGSLLLFLLSATVVTGFLVQASSGSADLSTIEREATEPRSERDPVVSPRENITAVSYQYGRLVAFAPNGTVYYYNDSYSHTWDIDPVPNTTATILVGYNNNTDGCPDVTYGCSRYVVQELNLTTRETTTVYAANITRYRGGGGWHDVDRVGQTLYVADIFGDAVFAVNTTTGIVEWEWRATSAFPTEGGGEYPDDWTHLNDVEVLADGRVMVDLRNQDQVVFVDRSSGVVENWTLGADDDYSILYEQHNPDYLPRERGGPTVLVADSQNNRIVEYQRQDESWTRSWVYSDRQMQWPRDADRLPNGHTLITDSNSDRVFEIDENGSVVWKSSLPYPYEAERLGTGDESAGGESAARLGLSSKNVETTVSSASATAAITDEIPFAKKLLNAVLFVVPRWMGPLEIVCTGIAAATVLVWGAFELYWSRLTVRSPFTTTQG